MNRIALAAFALALAFGWTGAFAQTNQPTDTQRLIEAFIQAGVIAPEKAAAARAAVGPQATSTALEILYPLRGNILDNGSGRGVIAEIRWRQVGSSHPVSISLLNSSGQELRRLATGTPPTGSFKWQYDPTIPEGSYELLVSVESGTEVAWTKSGLFTLRSLSSSTCRDSDAGIHPNVAGTADDRINGIGTQITDRSVASNGGPCSGATCTSVLEAFCENGKASSRVYQCSTGYSVNGACAQKPGQASTGSQSGQSGSVVPSYVMPASYQYSPAYINMPNTYAPGSAFDYSAQPAVPSQTTTQTGTTNVVPSGGGGGGMDSSRFIQSSDYFRFESFPSSYPTFPGGRGMPGTPKGDDIWILLPGGVGLSGADRLVEIFSGWFR